jgi:hypothetical protein
VGVGIAQSSSCGLIPNKGKRLICPPKHTQRFWSPPSLIFKCYQGLFFFFFSRRQSDRRAKVDHSPISSSQVKNEYSYTSTQYAFMASMKTSPFYGLKSIFMCHLGVLKPKGVLRTGGQVIILVQILQLTER